MNPRLDYDLDNLIVSVDLCDFKMIFIKKFLIKIKSAMWM